MKIRPLVYVQKLLGFTQPGYRRVVFEFAEEGVERLDTLVNNLGAPSRAEVLRRALGVYEDLVRRVKTGEGIDLTPENLHQLVFYNKR